MRCCLHYNKFATKNYWIRTTIHSKWWIFKAGSANAKRREPQSCLGWIFNSKLGCLCGDCNCKAYTNMPTYRLGPSFVLVSLSLFCSWIKSLKARQNVSVLIAWMRCTQKTSLKFIIFYLYMHCNTINCFIISSIIKVIIIAANLFMVAPT
jgi:hypothetical protein